MEHENKHRVFIPTLALVSESYSESSSKDTRKYIYFV